MNLTNKEQRPLEIIYWTSSGTFNNRKTTRYTTSTLNKIVYVFQSCATIVFCFKYDGHTTNDVPSCCRRFCGWLRVHKFSAIGHFRLCMRYPDDHLKIAPHGHVNTLFSCMLCVCLSLFHLEENDASHMWHLNTLEPVKSTHPPCCISRITSLCRRRLCEWRPAADLDEDPQMSQG